MENIADDRLRLQRKVFGGCDKRNDLKKLSPSANNTLMAKTVRLINRAGLYMKS